MEPNGAMGLVSVCGQCALVLCCLAGTVPSAQAQIAAPRLDIFRPGTSNGWVRLNSSFSSGTVLTLEASTNRLGWQAIGTLHDAVFNYPDAATDQFDQRYYRLLAASRGLTNDWKNQILFPTEPFLSPAGQDLRWVKFAILLHDPTRVYYQDSAKFLFHYDFATQRLPPFLGIDPASFDAVSLYRTNQQVVLGAVLYPPETKYPEYGVQFVGRDAYQPDDIARWFELVKATVYAPSGAGVYYIPVFEQNEMARTNADAFAAKGIPVASVERWISVNHVYSPGWALGRLKFFPASEIAAAFADGRLRPEDILLTDGVPAETPLVSGIISLTPSTPNSHTAILSQSFDIPFVYLVDPREQARVQALVSHKIILRATVARSVGVVTVLDVEGVLGPLLEAELLALKQPEPIDFMPRQSFGALSVSTDTLAPTDIRYFGGKAANYGLLRASIPNNCAPAIAFSFDLWDAFLEQTLPNGQTLRAQIHSRLAPYTNYPPDIVSLKTNLAAIRDLFTRTASFTSAQKQSVTNALAVFNPHRKIRFRSSTNVEDSEHFTGAGLYDSYSGCLLDDLDDDTIGPSQCDPAEPNERGVFRALQKVYASFYNDNAFLERLRHGVDETQVGMGVLVHHSFPDEEELANGVATLRFNFGAFTYITGELVSQIGATSVTNPDGTSLPEVVEVSRLNSVNLTLTRHSSLVPLGAYVMNWQSDYIGFVNLLETVGAEFRQFYPAKNGFYLDFEYKKDANLGLVIKQVREVPTPGSTNHVIPFLIDDLTSYRVAQEEFTDVFANHRLKSLWTLHTANLRLAGSNLVQGIYTQGRLEYVSDGTLQLLAGALTSWPNASNSLSGATDYWTTGGGTNQRAWRLDTTLITNVTGSQPPILTQRELAKAVMVAYARPMPTLSGAGAPETTTNETVTLEPCSEVVPGALLQRRALASSGVNIETSFYWPPNPGLAAGYTAPLVRFVETRISGLTSQPIELTNYYSQTYHPFHHNFTEEFIFEPRLEPGLPSATLAELNAANIQLIHAFRDFETNSVLRVLGLDQTFRRL